MTYNKEFDVLRETLYEAGDAILELYNKDVDIETKHDNSPVTEADLRANEIIIDSLRDEFPQDGIISEEEYSLEEFSKKRVWVIDPLDGTKDFINKTGEFSILVGLIEKGETVLSAVYLPVKRKLYYAKKSKGAFVEQNDETYKIQVSNTQEKDNLKMIISRNHFSAFEEKVSKKFGIKNFEKCGSIGIKLCLIAEGKADFYLNASPYLGKWDACAPALILKEAGGVVFDKNGEELQYLDGKMKMESGVLAINSDKFKEELLELFVE